MRPGQGAVGSVLKSVGHSGTQPGEPSITVESTSSGEAIVTVDGDAAVTNRLFYRQAADAAWTTGLTRSGDGTITQTGLTAGELYSFVVVSESGGYYSKPSNVVTIAIAGTVSHTYNVLAVIEPAERGEYIEVLCVEVK